MSNVLYILKLSTILIWLLFGNSLVRIHFLPHWQTHIFVFVTLIATNYCNRFPHTLNICIYHMMYKSRPKYHTDNYSSCWLTSTHSRKTYFTQANVSVSQSQLTSSGIWLSWYLSVLQKKLSFLMLIATHYVFLFSIPFHTPTRMRRECRERFIRHQFQRRSLVSDPGMHHGTCVAHVPWCMSGSLTRGCVENVPGIPGSCATHNLTYLTRGLWHSPLQRKPLIAPSHTHLHITTPFLTTSSFLCLADFISCIYKISPRSPIHVWYCERLTSTDEIYLYDWN